MQKMITLRKWCESAELKVAGITLYSVFVKP